MAGGMLEQKEFDSDLVVSMAVAQPGKSPSEGFCLLLGLARSTEKEVRGVLCLAHRIEDVFQDDSGQSLSLPGGLVLLYDPAKYGKRGVELVSLVDPALMANARPDVYLPIELGPVRCDALFRDQRVLVIKPPEILRPKSANGVSGAWAACERLLLVEADDRIDAVDRVRKRRFAYGI
jgi:hypothetical protein